MGTTNPRFTDGAAGVATGWTFADNCADTLVDPAVCDDTPWPAPDGTVTGRAAGGRFQLGATPAGAQVLAQASGTDYTRTLSQTVTLGRNDRRLRIVLQLEAGGGSANDWGAAVWVTPAGGTRTLLETLYIPTTSTALDVRANVEAYVGRVCLIEVVLTRTTPPLSPRALVQPTSLTRSVAPYFVNNPALSPFGTGGVEQGTDLGISNCWFYPLTPGSTVDIVATYAAPYSITRLRVIYGQGDDGTNAPADMKFYLGTGTGGPLLVHDAAPNAAGVLQTYDFANVTTSTTYTLRVTVPATTAASLELAGTYEQH